MPDPNTLERWKCDLQQVYDSLMKGAGEQFEAWFEEAAMLEAEIGDETEELRQCVADIKGDRHRYRQLLKLIPKVTEFSEEEIEKRTGKASQLLDIAGEITVMEIHLPRKVEKLRFLLKYPSQ
jgi:hypothetical protein